MVGARGKSDCVALCPFNIFQVRGIDDVDFEALFFLGSRADLFSSTFADKPGTKDRG